MVNKLDYFSNLKFLFFYYLFGLDKFTLKTISYSFPFLLESYFELILLEIIDWIQNDSKLFLYWILFTITISLCVRNEYGYDIRALDFIIFSTAMGYCIYLHKEFYPRETRFILIKLSIISFLLIKLFWPLILYTWPYNYWVVSFQELTNLIFFIWPELDFYNSK